ncbi:hypothetical protein P8918_13850 [Bacillus spizizenii]|nr:hypothetical protein [Bacillus spizizenii]MCY8890387.1 hypothetical protein [Bacillus spizizenii]MEC0842113.1 hypothetical protein [Bacillus spizizenii]
MSDETAVKDPKSAYCIFCVQNDIKPRSFQELALMLNLSINQLELTIETMMSDFPEEFKAIHSTGKR